MLYDHRQSQKKTQPYIINISRPHVETNSKFSLFSGTNWNVRCTSTSVVFPNAQDAELAGRDL
jgi:hypothetical protein